MTRRVLARVVIWIMVAIPALDATGQCRSGGQGGGRGWATRSFATVQNPGLNQFPQFNQQGLMQQAAMQQSYLQQLQLQRAILQQQYALQKAKEREESRQKRLATANARREKEAKRRAEQKGEVVALTDNK